MTIKKFTTTIILSSILLTVTFAYMSIPTEASPGTGQLFGTDANGSNLLQIDRNTGASNVVGNMGVGATPSLATDPTTGIMYVGTGQGNPRLFTVNPNNAITAFVGNTGLGFAAVGGMDFDASGNLYAAVNIAGDGGTGSDHLALLNKNNGQATIIGPFGVCNGVPPIPVNGAGSCSIEGMESIAFDQAGNLWGAHTARGSAGLPGLYSINAGTGQAQIVAPILDAAGAPPSGGITSLQFACDGTLYGGTARALGAAGDGGFLVTINPATGQFAFVGGASATLGSSLGGLAFEDGVCVIEVDIDIKPGSDPSSVSCKNDKGNVPVAVFGSNTFDATTIDLASLELNGVPVTEAHNKLHIDDINNDGFDDAVLHLDKTGVCDATSNEVDYPLKASADATLTGSNADGDFEGIGDIRIVKR